jgi:hypothetical protein
MMNIHAKHEEASCFALILDVELAFGNVGWQRLGVCCYQD